MIQSKRIFGIITYLIIPVLLLGLGFFTAREAEAATTQTGQTLYASWDANDARISFSLDASEGEECSDIKSFISAHSDEVVSIDFELRDDSNNEVKIILGENEGTGLFAGCTKLEDLVFLNNVDTSNVTSMQRMFYNCSSLKSLDLKSFDTGKVRSMKEMFSGCSSLISVDTGSFY